MISTAIAKEMTLQGGLQGVILVVAGSEDKSSRSALELRSNLQLAGVKVEDIMSLGEAMDLAAVLDDKIFVLLMELQIPFLKNIQKDDFNALQKFLQSVNRIFWLSRTAAGDPAYSLVSGLARTIRGEKNQRLFVTIEFETEGELSTNQVHSLCQVLKRTVFTTRNNTYESSFVEVDGSLEIGRVTPMDDTTTLSIFRHLQSPQPKIQGWDGQLPLDLRIEHPNLLDTLYWAEDDSLTHALGQHELDIRVEICSLPSNFQTPDIPTDRDSPSEISGTVIRCGRVCKFSPGDRVCAFGTLGFKTHARVTCNNAISIPDDMTLEEAASIPTAFLTSHLTLGSACVQPDDAILIHSAAEATGQAAIQMARYLGGDNIFATVGSQAEKQLLIDAYQIPEDRIFSSRNISFAQEIKRVTKNGVNVVYNSLSGRGLRASWDCIAPFGRFIDLSKQDMASDFDLPMRPFARNVSYSSFDLMQWVRHRPQLVADSLRFLMGLFVERRLIPVRPIKTYRMSEVEDAFRSVNIGPDIGKRVIRMVSDVHIPVGISCTKSFCGARL